MSSTNDSESFASLFASSQAPSRKSVRTGEKLDVTVLKIGTDAVFVQLNNKEEGFIERSELSSKSGELAVKEGTVIHAQVVEVGGKSGATRLRALMVKEAPVEGVAPVAEGPILALGAHVKGTVTGIEKYGVFIQIANIPGRKGRGLLPMAEVVAPRNTDPHKLFTVGQEVETKIVSLEEGKIRLSTKALKADAERSDFEAFEKGKTGDKKGDKPNPRSFGTLGDLLKKSGKA